MKKLIIAACVVAFAAVSQAANLNWSAYGALNDGAADTDWYTGGQAYLIYVTDADIFAVGVDDGGLLTVTGGSVVHSTSIGDGYASGALDGGNIGAGLADGSTYQFAVLFTTEGVAGSDLPTSGLYGLNDNEGNLYSVTWNKDTGASFYNEDAFAAVTESIAPVPEPTSGLMLLLGVAGLALRRKQK